MDSPTNHIKTIAIMIAMEGEAEASIAEFNLRETILDNFQNLPMRVFSGDFQQVRLHIVISGKDARYGVDNIGPLAASVGAQVVISTLQPDLLISAGTCGGFGEKGAEIGTVYLSDERFIFHDRRVPLAGFDQSNEGHYPALNVRRMAADLNLKTGIVSSGSSLEKSSKDIDIIKKYNASCKEMEAAAVAWVAMLHRQAFIAIKSVTNLLDNSLASEDQFSRHFSIATVSLTENVRRVLNYCIGRTIGDLAG